METAMNRRERSPCTTNNWRSFAAAFTAWQQRKVSRRSFLKAGGAAGVGLLLPVKLSAKSTPPSRKEPWLTIAAVQEQLFPSEKDSPGAADVHAAAYLERMMSLPRFPIEEKTFILQGPVWLNELAQQQFNQPFPALTSTQQEQLLQKVARSSAGENWLSLLLTYIFEAVLSAPAYGGNPEQVGWHWLQHNPGFPLPNSHNTFDVLVKK
jgi:gluconate 2-dehydrogenase gamma chain